MRPANELSSFVALTVLNARIAVARWHARAEFHHHRGAPNDFHIASCHAEMVEQALRERLLQGER